MSKFIKNILSKLHIEEAILWNLIGQGFNFISWPVITLLIVKYFSKETQGYYYTFSSLLQIQMLLELGLGTCIVQFTSHEFAHLQWNQSIQLLGPVKHLHRLISVARLALKWYCIAALLLFFGVGFAGEIFFSTKTGSDLFDWRGGWWLLCLATACGFPVLALMSILNGCNEITWLARTRIFQNLTRTFVMIAALISGLALYAPGLASFTSVVIVIILTQKRWHPFIRQIKEKITLLEKISWKEEIWPLQWRIALSWASGYLMFFTFTPILFKFTDAATAGRFGMTWALVQACISAAQVFTSTRQPKFGAMIARQEWSALRRFWWLSLAQTLIVFIGMSICFVAGIFTLKFLWPEFSERILEWNAIIPILLAAFLNQSVFSIANLARAEKKEPFLTQSIVMGILVFAGSFIFVREYGVLGITWNYCGAVVIAFFWSFIILSKTEAFKKR
jgi:hypothetical protein